MRPNHDPVVYYLASSLGGVVKIGTTVNLRTRLDRYFRHHQAVSFGLLATEPGGPAVEAERHRQFSHLRQIGEWFWLTPELQRWIEGLQK